MKRLFCLIIGLMLFSFSNSFAVIEAEITNIYSSKIIGNSGVLSYSFDVLIPKNGRKKGDYIKFDLRPNKADIFNDYSFTNTNIEVISGTQRGLYEVFFPVEQNKVKDMKVRITGNVVANNLWNLLPSVRVIIGDLNGNGEDVKDWLNKSFFRFPSTLKVKVDKKMSLGKAYPGGLLSTKNGALSGYPAEISITLDDLQNKNDKVSLEITENGKVELNANGERMIADVWFRDESSSESQQKKIEKKLIKKGNIYETGVIKLDGSCRVPEGQAKGIYRGTIKVRVTYGE